MIAVLYCSVWSPCVRWPLRDPRARLDCSCAGLGLEPATLRLQVLRPTTRAFVLIFDKVCWEVLTSPPYTEFKLIVPLTVARRGLTGRAEGLTGRAEVSLGAQRVSLDAQRSLTLGAQRSYWARAGLTEIAVCWGWVARGLVEARRLVSIQDHPKTTLKPP